MPQGYKYSPSSKMLHLQDFYRSLTPPKVWNCPRRDYFLIGRDSRKKAGKAAAGWEALHEAELEIPPEKCPGPRKEVKSLGARCITGSTGGSPDLKKSKTNKDAPMKERITTINGNCSVLEETCAQIFCHFSPTLQKEKQQELRQEEAVKPLTRELQLQRER